MLALRLFIGGTGQRHVQELLVALTDQEQRISSAPPAVTAKNKVSKAMLLSTFFVHKVAQPQKIRQNENFGA